MSGSLASAKAKRAGIAPQPPTMSQSAPPPPPPPPGARMTFQQVISLIDNRLIALEKGAKSQTDSTTTRLTDQALNDLDAKFMMLAVEITVMKDVIMKLQSFTMDVNKTLFEERIQIMSEMNEHIKAQVTDETGDDIRAENVSDVAAS